MDLNKNITKNFKWKELFYSNTARKYGIDNTTSINTYILNLKHLTEKILQPIRNEFGPIKINSGFRSKELNKKIGGSKTSEHCTGEAIDIVPIRKEVSLLDIVEWIYNEKIYNQLIIEYPKSKNGWIHCSRKIECDDNKLELLLHDEKNKYQDTDIYFLDTYC